jgi:hypothetical protein
MITTDPMAGAPLLSVATVRRLCAPPTPRNAVTRIRLTHPVLSAVPSIRKDLDTVLSHSAQEVGLR